MNRRNLFKGLAAVGAGLILPPTLAENAEAGRRFWAGWRPEQPRQEMDFSFMDPYESPWKDDGLPIGRGLYTSSLDTNETPLGRRIVHDFNGLRDPQWRTSERVYYEVEGQLLYSISWTQSGWIRE